MPGTTLNDLQSYVFDLMANAESHTFQSGAVATGAGTVLNVRGLNAVGVQITGITIATVMFQGSIDGTNYVAIQAVNLNNGSVGTTATADGIFIIRCPGLYSVQCNITAYTSGTITIVGYGMLVAGDVYTDIEISSGIVTAAQGAAGAGAWLATLVPASSGGCSLYRNIDLDETGVLASTAAVHQIYGWYLYNAATNVRYIKVYDKATAPTSTDTPILTLPVPPASGANVSIPPGLIFALGIGLRATTGVADNDVGAPAANDVVVNVWYK